MVLQNLQLKVFLQVAAILNEKKWTYFGVNPFLYTF